MHRIKAREIAVRCAVVTVSDTRTEETDTSGRLMVSRLTDAGHEIIDYRIVKDEPERITALLDELAVVADVVLFNGGTGISRRDTTFEAVSRKFEKTLPGFGELFRMLSFDEIGPAALLSRATAGVYRDTIVFSTPGSTNAVQLAMDRLITDELHHFAWEILR